MTKEESKGKIGKRVMNTLTKSEVMS
jgi:hypothetical protein